MRKFLYENGLTVALLGLFLLSFTGQIVAGRSYHNQNLLQHGREPASYAEYVQSGDFVEAIFENWESEFLQMGAYVLLAAYLRQKGAEDSKKFEPEEADEDPALHRGDPRAPWPVRRGGWVLRLYSYSLSIALFVLFGVSLLLHASGGAKSDCEDQLMHGGACQSMFEYMGSSRFWFESFQNWQSEFLSVAVLGLLSIFLRQRGSSQSKPVHHPHSETGTS